MVVSKTSLDKLAFLEEIMKKFMTCLGAVALATTIGASNANADCGDVSIGAMGWASGESITAVATFVLEVGYGCNVSVVPTDTILPSHHLLKTASRILFRKSGATLRRPMAGSKMPVK